MTPDKSREELSEEKRRFWKQHIEDWQATNLSQVKYCRQHHLIAHQFTYWKQKFKFVSDQSFIELKLPPASYPPTFSPAPPLWVNVDRFQVAIERDFDPIALRQLIYSLEHL